MVKNKKKLPNKNISLEYQIKTRYRDKKLSSMSREVKNLQGNDWFQKNISKDSRTKQTNITQPNIKIKIKLLKKIKKEDKKHEEKKTKLNINEINDNTNNEKKSANNNKKINQKKIYSEINKYFFQGNEYFDLKEIFIFLNDKLKINLDSPNIKIKDKEYFKAKMNELLNKLFVIYFNKILITEKNLCKFLEFLSQYVKLETNEVINLLNTKIVKKSIEEKIELEQYFKPRLILVEK